MQKAHSHTKQGFSLIEIIISSALMLVFATLFIGAVLAGETGEEVAGQRIRAQFVAEEGLEAARNIRDSGWANLALGTWGIGTSTGKWAFVGSSDTEGAFTRVVQVQTQDAVTKLITSMVTWQETAGRTGTVVLVTTLGNTTPLPGGTQAGVMLPDYSHAYIGSSGKELDYVTLQNTGSSTITLTKLTISWNTTASKMTQIYGTSTLLWSTTGPGSPLAQESSGSTTVIQSTGIAPGAVLPLNRFVFTQTMHNNAFTILFTMADNSTKTITTPTLP